MLRPFGNISLLADLPQALLRQCIAEIVIYRRSTRYIYYKQVHQHLALFSYHPLITAANQSIPTSMCPIFVVALLPFVYSAIPLTPHQSDSTSPFILHAFEPGSPIHLSSLNANEGHFWLGKATSSSCRAESKRDCPTGTETVLVVSGGGHAGLVRPSSPLPTCPLSVI